MRSTALAVDPDRIRYRHPLAGDDGAAELASTIAALEARVAETRSPIDGAELADAYYLRSQGGNRADLAAAERHAEASIAILRTPNAALVTLAKVRNAQHRFRDAIALAKEHAAVRPGAGAYIVIATAHLALGELVLAAGAADRAIHMRPDPGGHLTRALVLQAQGRDAEAAHDFARAVALEQSGDRAGAVRARALWARFLIRRGEYGGARTLLAEALRIVPDAPLALAIDAERELRSGNAATAAKRFERAFERSREVRYLMDEARARELAGSRDAAAALRVQIESMVRGELRDDALGHTVDLVEVLADRGSPAAVDEAVKLGTAELERRASFEVRFQLARALHLAKRDHEAILHVQAALANGAREAQLYELAARVEARRGNADRAAVYGKLADELDPGRSGWRTLGLGAAP